MCILSDTVHLSMLVLGYNVKCYLCYIKKYLCMSIKIYLVKEKLNLYV